MAKFVLGIAAALAALAIGGGLFIESGYYDIGADDHHTKLILAIIERLRERSIEVRARAIPVPALEDPRGVATGARRYAELCAGCHLAPGVTKSDLRPGCIRIRRTSRRRRCSRRSAPSGSSSTASK